MKIKFASTSNGSTFIVILIALVMALALLSGITLSKLFYNKEIFEIEKASLSCQANLHKILEAKLRLAIERQVDLTNGFTKAELFGPVGEEPVCPTTKKTYALGPTLGDKPVCGEFGHNLGK